MQQVIVDTQKNKVISKPINGKYNPPDKEVWEREKSKGLDAYDLIRAEVPEYDNIRKKAVSNEVIDHEKKQVIWGYKILDRDPDEAQKRVEEKQKTEERNSIRAELKSTSAIRDDLNNPERVAELEKRIEKLEKLILD